MPSLISTEKYWTYAGIWTGGFVCHQIHVSVHWSLVYIINGHILLITLYMKTSVMFTVSLLHFYKILDVSKGYHGYLR